MARRAMLAIWPVFLLLLLNIQLSMESDHHNSLPRVIFGRHIGGFMWNPFRKYLDNKLYSTANITLGTITQRLDNFDPKNTKTWQQHYQYNPTFYNGKGLIFLLIGGESKISMRWIADEGYAYLVWAKKHGAAAFQVEHRFYGDSHPLPDMSTESYQYFTIEQALADLRVFILEMNKKYFSNIAKPRWVLFGGSYPGSLSAWFREANPDITIGAISSSCAVNTITDYWGYIDNMGSIYGDVNAQCRNNIQEAFRIIHEKVYTIEGRKELSKTFNLCPEFPNEVTPRDIQFFFSNLIGVFQDINQYTGDNRDPARQAGLGVPRACEIMTDTKENNLINRINNVMNFYNSFYPENCQPNNYTDYMQSMKNITYDPPDYERASARGWIWQTCTQLGYFQTTDGGHSMFGSALPMDFYVDQCQQMFGLKYDADFTRAGTTETRLRHGGPDHYKGTNTVFPNGSYDPWRSLGYARNQTGNVYAFLIEGTAHCADMYPANETDKQSLKDARIFLGQQLDLYIRQSLEAVTTTPAVTTTSSVQQPTTTAPAVPITPAVTTTSSVQQPTTTAPAVTGTPVVSITSVSVPTQQVHNSALLIQSLLLAIALLLNY